MKISKLIAALQQAERDLGDVDVEIYNGFEYIAPPVEEGDCFPVGDVKAYGMKSYVNTNRDNDSAAKVYIAYGS